MIRQLARLIFGLALLGLSAMAAAQAPAPASSAAAATPYRVNPGDELEKRPAGTKHIVRGLGGLVGSQRGLGFGIGRIAAYRQQ